MKVRTALPGWALGVLITGWGLSLLILTRPPAEISQAVGVGPFILSPPRVLVLSVPSAGT